MAFLKISRDTRSSLLRDRYLLVTVAVVTASFFGQLLLIAANFANLPAQIPLFYSKPWGDKMLAPSAYLWIIPSMTIAICAINLLLAVFFFKSNLLLFRALTYFNLLIAVMTIYDVLKIITLLV